MYVAMRMSSIWRLALATATTSFLVAVVVLSPSNQDVSSSQAPACGAFTPAAQAMSR